MATDANTSTSTTPYSHRTNTSSYVLLSIHSPVATVAVAEPEFKRSGHCCMYNVICMTALNDPYGVH